MPSTPNNSKRKKIAQKVADAANMGMSVDMVFIFTMVMKESWRTLSQQFLNLLTYPLASVFDFINVATMWAQAHLNRKKSGNMKKRYFINATLYTAAAIATAGATAGALLAHTVFALAAPIIFAVQCGVKTLFNAGAAIYYAGKAKATYNPHKKVKYKLRAKTHAAASIVGLLYTAGITAVSVFAKVIMAPLIIIGGLIGAGQIIASKLKARRKTTNPYKKLHEAKPKTKGDRTSSAKIRRRLSVDSVLCSDAHAINSAPAGIVSAKKPGKHFSGKTLFAPKAETRDQPVTYPWTPDFRPLPVIIKA